LPVVLGLPRVCASGRLISPGAYARLQYYLSTMCLFDVGIKSGITEVSFTTGTLKVL
jgi:hypothetical protein